MGRFVKAHAIENFTMNPFFPVNTLRIMRGAIAAEREGRSPAPFTLEYAE